MYWAANNVLSLTQARLVKTKWLKDALGMKEPPKADPKDDDANPFKKFAAVCSYTNTCANDIINPLALRRR